MSSICIFNRFSLMSEPRSYPLGDELQKIAEVKRCDLQHTSISRQGDLLYQEEPLKADLFVWRIIEEYWRSALYVLSAAEKAGAATINSPQAIEICADKATTNKLLAEKGIPFAQARIIPKGAWAFPENGKIIKPLDRGGGSGVRMIRLPERVPDLCLQQEYLGEDTAFARVIFINGKILGFHKRRAVPGSLANNFDLGGEIIAWDAPQKALELARAAHNLSQTFFSAIDLVESANGWLVVEINSTPGYRGLVELHGPGIHQQVAEEIAEAI